ncbi:hypothetical protein MJD09_13000, partial [bacterium]|nr:hypothetical protein [bacterium]
DRPFFYKFEPNLPQPFGLFATLITLSMLSVLGLVLLKKPLGIPFLKQISFISEVAVSRQLKFFLLIFFSLGMGFMLIEIALFQKLTLFLGEPVLTLTVLLFSLLLGSGIGSLLSSVFGENKHWMVAVASLAGFIITCVYVIYIDALFGAGFDAKVTAAIMLLPLGLVLGFPFPLSVRLMKEYGLGNSVYVMWGVNGVASVLGSALTMIIGILAGFSYALILGAVLYAIVAGLAVRIAPVKARQALNSKQSVRAVKAKAS